MLIFIYLLLIYLFMYMYMYMYLYIYIYVYVALLAGSNDVVLHSRESLEPPAKGTWSLLP